MSSKFPKPLFILTGSPIQQLLKSPGTRLLRPDDTAAMRTEEPLLSPHSIIEHTSDRKRPGRYFLPFTLEDYYKIQRKPGKTPRRPVHTLRVKEGDLPKKRETMEVRWSQERMKRMPKVKSIFS
jgi:hypothetical protein